MLKISGWCNGIILGGNGSEVYWRGGDSVDVYFEGVCFFEHKKSVAFLVLR